MDVFLMYLLMIADLTWTLLHHKEAGELNPIFSRLLSDNEVQFVYIKLAANSIATVAVVILQRLRPVLGHVLAIFGVLVYGTVVYLHAFVDYCLSHTEQVQGSYLWHLIQGGG
jgi:hypothetical protein